jgi:hypothetical protein
MPCDITRSALYARFLSPVWDAWSSSTLWLLNSLRTGQCSVLSSFQDNNTDLMVVMSTPLRGKNTLEIRNMDKYDQPKCLCIGYISSHHHLYRCKITIKSQTIPLYLHKHPIKSEWIIWLTWKSLLIMRPFTDNSRNASHHSSDVRFIQIIPLIDAKSQWRSHHTP